MRRRCIYLESPKLLLRNKMWALHFHILARTGRQSLSQSMRNFFTGYVVNFNKRHKRSGHLFQNRYKSIVCEDDPYLLERDGIAHGRRPKLVGGGLVRSLGDWSQVVSFRRKNETVSSDARILGGGDFVDRILSEAEKKGHCACQEVVESDSGVQNGLFQS